MTNAELSASQSATRRGRPRAFDPEEALDRAAEIFIERGYHGTSIPELTEAMRLSAGSVYKAFGDKRGVFLAALDRYVAQSARRRARLLEIDDDGAGKVRALLSYFATVAQGGGSVDGRRGCLVVSSATELAETDPEIAERVAASQRLIEESFAAALREGRADGSVSRRVEPEGAARLLLAAAQGFRVLGKAGRSRDEMMLAVESAMTLLT